MTKRYPILEFDEDRTSITMPDPFAIGVGTTIPARGVACFFQDVIEQLKNEDQLTHIGDLRSEMGRHPVYRYNVEKEAVTLFHPGLGGPLAAAFLEELIAVGVTKFIVCGGCGVRGLALGDFGEKRLRAGGAHGAQGGYGCGEHLRLIRIAGFADDRLERHKCGHHGCRGFRIIVILSDKIGRKTEPVICIGFPVWHRRIDPGNLVFTCFVVTEKKLIILLIIICRFSKRYSVFRMVCKAHSETICLYSFVTCAIRSQWLGRNPKE